MNALATRAGSAPLKPAVDMTEEDATPSNELSSTAKPLEAALSIESRSSDGSAIATPTGRENPEPPSLNAPKLPTNGRLEMPALSHRRDALTPSPGGAEVAVS